MDFSEAKIIQVTVNGVKKWRVVSKDGKKNLGTFNSRKAALRHLGRIEHFKKES